MPFSIASGIRQGRRQNASNMERLSKGKHYECTHRLFYCYLHLYRRTELCLRPESTQDQLCVTSPCRQICCHYTSVRTKRYYSIRHRSASIQELVASQNMARLKLRCEELPSPYNQWLLLQLSTCATVAGYQWVVTIVGLETGQRHKSYTLNEETSKIAVAEERNAEYMRIRDISERRLAACHNVKAAKQSWPRWGEFRRTRTTDISDRPAPLHKWACVSTGAYNMALGTTGKQYGAYNWAHNPFEMWPVI